jgi:hypothetical protein
MAPTIEEIKQRNEALALLKFQQGITNRYPPGPPPFLPEAELLKCRICRGSKKPVAISAAYDHLVTI